MKNIVSLYLAIGALFMACNTTNPSSEMEGEGQPAAAVKKAPFSRGVNFSQWFEAFSAEGIQFTRFIEQDFINVKGMGADVIRLPIRMHNMTAGAPDFALHPLMLRFLDSAVEWAERHEIYLIIDNHSFDPVAPTNESVEAILVKVWAQIAERYKESSEYVVYEILNEPHGISDKRWGEIQGAAVEAIRKVDKTHAIIVGGTDYNSIGKLSSIPKYSDTNLIYTFHFYDPHIFTHQGATWGDPSMASLAGVPFPYNAKRMPKTPDDLKGTWVASALQSYAQDAAFSKLYASLNKAVAFSKERNVPVFCGEFGVYMIQSPAEDRVKWYEFTTSALDKRNISRASWDYFGGFGIFNNSIGGDFNSDLNVEVVHAMGFAAPPQRAKITRPFLAGFTMYDDYPLPDFSMGYWGEDAVFSMYDTRADEGEYAIRWGDLSQYDVFFISFDRNGDLSYLAEQGYCLEFRARTQDKVRFDVRFVNPETPSSIPWRMKYSVTEEMLPQDGQWRTIRIPFADMTEHGAWVNATYAWLGPQGKFAWNNIKQLEFVSEDGDLKNCFIWFDSIKIMKP